MNASYPSLPANFYFYFFSYTDVYSRIQNHDGNNGLPPSQNRLHTMSTRCGLSINLGRNRLDLEISYFYK